MSQKPDERIVTMLAALSQPTRLKIVEVIAEGGDEGTPAGQIALAVHCPASTLSFHLKELTQAGLLKATPQGRFIRYSVIGDSFVALGNHVAALPGAQGAAAKTRTTRRAPSGRKRRKSEAGRAADSQLSIFED